MNRKRTMRIATALAIASAAVLMSGCGSSNTAAPLVGGPAAIAGFPGYAGSAGGCVPISQQIPFIAQGAAMNSASIAMGYLPGGQAYGQVAVGQGGGGGPYMNIRPNGQPGVDGLLSMNIVPSSQYGAAIGYTGGAQVNISGIIQIAQATQADIMYQTGSGFSYGGSITPGYNPVAPGYPSFGGISAPGTTYGAGQLCVSSIAMSAGYAGNMVYDATTYLFLNGSVHGYILAL